MTTPFVGEIQLFGFNFAPRGWAQCAGMIMPIQQNTALFSLIGTYYGGNGTSTFQLPNLASRAACAQGQGPGLTMRDIGDNFGEQSVLLNSTQMPAHTHTFNMYTQSDSTRRSNTPATGNALVVPGQSDPFQKAGTPSTNFLPTMLSPSGNSLPHDNQQPFLGVNFCIALQGAFPQFS